MRFFRWGASSVPAAPWWDGVSGWKADFRGAQEQITSQRGHLAALAGDRITSSWVVWDGKHGRWFADMPVVLCFESGKQLELAWQKSDDLSVSWNTIDLSAPSSAWIKPIEWRRDALPELQAVIGLAVVDVSATSSIFRTSPSEGPGVPTADWITDGIWFVLTNGGLHVYNGLDENALSLEPPPVDDDHASQLL